jgi:hypothetical protein
VTLEEGSDAYGGEFNGICIHDVSPAGGGRYILATGCRLSMEVEHNFVLSILDGVNAVVMHGLEGVELPFCARRRLGRLLLGSFPPLLRIKRSARKFF